MEKDFETLIAGFTENNIGICDHFINDKLARHLRENLLDLVSKQLLKAAGVGNDSKFIQNTAIRSDAIYWLDRKDNNVHENNFLDHIDAFVAYLNLHCYTGITGYEFHYALYETGSFYRKHLDQFQNNSTRRFSMISYLNEDWVEADGGQLSIHTPDYDRKIDPIQGKTVFFKSNELEHEVLLTHKRRMSITGWLKGN